MIYTYTYNIHGAVYVYIHTHAPIIEAHVYVTYIQYTCIIAILLHACVYVYTYIYTHVYTHIDPYMKHSMYVYMCVCMYTHRCTGTCMRVKCAEMKAPPHMVAC
jgi:hypothetical protein